MRMKLIKVASLIFLFFIIFLFVFGRAFPSYIDIRTVQNSNSHILVFDGDLFYRQTLNNCGPYSVMAVINVLKKERISPELLAREMTWRIHKNLTFPIGLMKLLRKYGIKTKEYILNNKSTDEKINWIKGKLEQGFPIIILIKINHIQHYLTILEYDEHGVMLYDSLQEKNSEDTRKTIIDKQCRVGNRYYPYEKLITLWDNGGYKIFFKNWAIVCYL